MSESLSIESPLRVECSCRIKLLVECRIKLYTFGYSTEWKWTRLVCGEFIYVKNSWGTFSFATFKKRGYKSHFEEIKAWKILVMKNESVDWLLWRDSVEGEWIPMYRNCLLNVTLYFHACTSYASEVLAWKKELTIKQAVTV